MKYPMTSLYLGQLILNQPITQELFEAFYDEYKNKEKDNIQDFCHKDLSFIDWTTLAEMSGAISINNIDVRKFIVGNISWIYDFQEKKVDSVEQNTEYKDEDLMPGEVTKLKVREIKDGKTFFDIHYPESVENFIEGENNANNNQE